MICIQIRHILITLATALREMKTKISGILFFFFLLAPLVSSYTFLHVQRRKVRKETKHMIIAGVDKSELVLLKFTPKDSINKLEWKHSKEFKYNEQMYDIVERNKQGDTTYYYCWWDSKETKLNQQLDDLFAIAWGHDPIKQKNEANLTVFYKSLYCEDFESPVNKQLPQSEKRMVLPYSFNELNLRFAPPVPPPEFS